MDEALVERAATYIRAGRDVSEALVAARTALAAEAEADVVERDRRKVRHLELSALMELDTANRRLMEPGSMKHRDDRMKWPMKLTDPDIDGRTYVYRLTPEEVAELEGQVLGHEYRFAADVIAPKRSHRRRHGFKYRAKVEATRPSHRVVKDTRTDLQRAADRGKLTSIHIGANT